MGTRGLYGLRKNGVDKLTYNHFDSYPDGLGKVVTEFCKRVTEKELGKLYDSIVLVDEDGKPTAKQIEFCKSNGTVELNVGCGSESDWYCLLRRLQGDLLETMRIVNQRGKVYMIDNRDFILASLFCEYAYIINLDTHKLEFWIGWQKEPDETNRYGTHGDDGYYPCRLVLEIPLSEIESDNWVERMNKIDMERT